MEMPTYFEEFLNEIRLTAAQKTELKEGHERLRRRLREDASLAEHIVSTFLQGSYRRFTAVRPKGGSRADIDVIVVTDLCEKEFTPAKAMNLFVSFLDEHYKGKWKLQNRSFGIELSSVDFDLVITSAPSEREKKLLLSEAVTTTEDLSIDNDWRLNSSWLTKSSRNLLQRHTALEALKEAQAEAEWKLAPLRIPDRALKDWQDTHPLEQIVWTQRRNASTNGHFVNVVKALKWWRLENYSAPKHPKGFPLERIVGDCCPQEFTSVAEGVTLTLEQIVTKYAPYVALKCVPELPDYGVPRHNVLHRITVADFASFYQQATEGAVIARQALTSAKRRESSELWRKLFGSKFPLAPEGGRGNSFTTPTSPARPGPGRFA